MADSKESFEILENGSGDGVAATSSQIGEASGGKIGMTVFPFRDASGNLRMPEVNASNVLKTDGSSVTQPVSGTVGISGTVPVTGPLTDTQLRASAVPVSGSVSVSNFPATQNVQGTRSNAGTDTTSGKTHLTVGGSDGTNLRPVSTDATGKLNINNISGTVSLPTGAATSANQTTEIDYLGNLIGTATEYCYGILATSATTADQTVISVTVPSGKVLYLTGYSIDTSNVAATLVKVCKNTPLTEASNPGTQNGNIFCAFRTGANTAVNGAIFQDISIPVKFGVAGDVVKVTVTPSGTQSTTWRASLRYILRNA